MRQCERYHELLLRQSRKSSQLLPPLARHEIEREHVGMRHRELCRRRRGTLHRRQIQLLNPTPFAEELEPPFIAKAVQQFRYQTRAAFPMTFLDFDRKAGA